MQSEVKHSKNCRSQNEVPYQMIITEYQRSLWYQLMKEMIQKIVHSKIRFLEAFKSPQNISRNSHIPITFL